MILWHSMKYPPKKDGTYYVRTSGYTTYDLVTTAVKIYDIHTYDFTVKGGWNTHYDNTVNENGEEVRILYSRHAMEFSKDDQWAEVEYVSD